MAIQFLSTCDVIRIPGFHRVGAWFRFLYRTRRVGWAEDVQVDDVVRSKTMYLRMTLL